MYHHFFCDLLHGIHGVQEMQVSVIMAHNTEFVHTLLSTVLKLRLHGHHGSGEGDVTQPQSKHWPINDSLRNSHTVRVNCAGAPSCWNYTCYIIPLLLCSGITRVNAVRNPKSLIYIYIYIPMKLVRLIKMCLTETYSRVQVDKNLSDMFPIRNGLKQGDALSHCFSTLLWSMPLGGCRWTRMAWN